MYLVDVETAPPLVPLKLATSRLHIEFGSAHSTHSQRLKKNDLFYDTFDQVAMDSLYR